MTASLYLHTTFFQFSTRSLSAVFTLSSTLRMYKPTTTNRVSQWMKSQTYLKPQFDFKNHWHWHLFSFLFLCNLFFLNKKVSTGLVYFVLTICLLTFGMRPIQFHKYIAISAIWQYVVCVKSTVKISSIFVAFLENINFNYFWKNLHSARW